MMNKLFAGTSGWAYPSWKPGFYPVKHPGKRLLEHYGTRLNSVEVNYTFRKLPTEAQLAGWLAAVAPEFRFSFKAPEVVTHRRRLRDCGDAVEQFVASLEPVRAAGALGCILFQLPPNFKAEWPRLEAFLAMPQLAGAGRIAFEFRHSSWFQEETWSILRAYGAAVCVAESEDLETPDVLTAPDFACYRLRMPGGYSSSEVALHAKRFRTLSQTRDVFVYYKHEDAPHGPLAAEAMLLQARAKLKARKSTPARGQVAE
ncbi:MAG: DUF72 domain-containing protein [Janthinobacterium lividum]